MSSSAPGFHVVHFPLEQLKIHICIEQTVAWCLLRKIEHFPIQSIIHGPGNMEPKTIASVKWMHFQNCGNYNKITSKSTCWPPCR